mmetsp:Transcript_33335/g.81933  ORF Transcript_33335/g.81933 Transcript_33335/m.81933 type:complete len:192 (-) Transcript_33335:6-581(-)
MHRLDLESPEFQTFVDLVGVGGYGGGSDVMERVQRALDRRHGANWKSSCVLGGERGNRNVIEAKELIIAEAERELEAATAAAAAGASGDVAALFDNLAQRDRSAVVSQLEKKLSDLRLDMATELSAHDGKVRGGSRGHKDIIANLRQLHTLVGYQHTYVQWPQPHVYTHPHHYIRYRNFRNGILFGMCWEL